MTGKGNYPEIISIMGNMSFIDIEEDNKDFGDLMKHLAIRGDFHDDNLIELYKLLGNLTYTNISFLALKYNTKDPLKQEHYEFDEQMHKSLNNAICDVSCRYLDLS